MISRRGILGALALAISLALPGQGVADVFDDARARGSLRIGVSLFTPWTLQAEDGTLSGYEIDLGRLIAADLGVEPDFKVTAWEEIIPALQAGEIDMIAAGMAITPGRALEVSFTRPYFRSGVGLATNTERTRDVASLEALNAPGHVIATVTDTLADGVAGRVFDKAQIRRLATAEEAEALVLAGEASAYVASMPEVRFFALRNGDAIDLPLAEPMVASVAGFAVKPGEQRMLNFLNAWIEARTADRSIGAFHAYWFESLDWAGERAE